MQHLFISDVHLGAFDPETNHSLEQEVIHLIDYCDQKGIQLHLLGDIFDYWMEYPGFIPKLGRQLLDRFETYNLNSGRNTVYITGNHDCWTLTHFLDRGFNVNEDYYLLEQDDKRMFLCHGDGLADRIYGLPRPLLHRLLRSKLFIWFFQRLFPNENGLRIMKAFSDFTRDENQIEPQRLSRWAAHILKNETLDAVICGHDHLARVETFNEGTYINSGAFYRDRTLASYNNQQFELVVWDDDQRNLKTYRKEVNLKPDGSK